MSSLKNLDPKIDRAVMTAFKKYMNGVRASTYDTFRMIEMAISRVTKGEEADKVVQELSRPLREAYEQLQLAKAKVKRKRGR